MEKHSKNSSSDQSPTAKRDLLLIMCAFIVLVALSQAPRIKTFIADYMIQFAPVKAGQIGIGELKVLLATNKATIINVQTPYDGEIEHTSMLLSAADLAKYPKLLPSTKSDPIVVYDRNMALAPAAQLSLKTAGYTNVRVLAGGMNTWQKTGGKVLNLSTLADAVIPKNGVDLGIPWGNQIKQLVDLGVIDKTKFLDLVKPSADQQKVLDGTDTGTIHMDAQNSQFVVDVLWALGLAQKSIVYELGPMGKEYKSDVGNFASTGGWNLAKGDAVSYLSKYDLIPLTDKQQQHVGEIAKNVYRPCCGNATWFPDCNHGMAALAIIELLVSNNVDDATIYKKLLGFNSIWFSDSYVTLATYFAREGQDWTRLDPKLILSEKYSSGGGASIVAQRVGPVPYLGSYSGSCGA